jgi:hypothetical protein
MNAKYAPLTPPFPKQTPFYALFTGKSPKKEP